MQAILITFVSVLVGGGLAGATIVGVVNSQTAAPSKSQVNVQQADDALQYGQTQ